jgi:hypothetical protein
MASRKTKQNVEQPTNYCAISENFVTGFVEDIHQNVCIPSKEFPLTEHNGKHYCFFHLPKSDKDNNKFREILKKRLTDIESRIQDKNRDILDLPKYDFRYVWFPKVYFSNHEFCAFADFSNAVFTDYAGFGNTTFYGSVKFFDSIFLKKTDFSWSKFFKLAEFQFVLFEEVDFSWAEFHLNTTFDFSFFKKGNFHGAEIKDYIGFKYAIFVCASFQSAKFYSYAEFKGTVFIQSRGFSFIELLQFETRISADFRLAEFKDTSHIVFENAKFCCNVSFFNAKVNGYLNFEGNVFLDSNELLSVIEEFESKIVKLMQTIENNKIENFSPVDEKPEKAILDFQKVKIDNAKEVSFHSCVLRPNWFVNVDSRKIVFTNTEWKNVSKNSNGLQIKKEQEAIEDRTIKNSNELLKIAFRQLAENAEKNDRFEEASKFRYVAMECERVNKAKLTQPFTLSWWYWLSSSYGESWIWCAILLLALLFGVFPYFYSENYFKTCSTDRPIAASISICESKDAEISKNCSCSDEKLNYGDAVLQSLYTATLQNVDYRKPFNWRGELWIILEKIFAPLQAALLALAIRRKFMR